MYNIILKDIYNCKIDKTIITTDIFNFTKCILQKCGEYFKVPEIGKFIWISYEDSDQFDVDVMKILQTEINPSVTIGEFKDIVKCSVCTILNYFEKGIFE